MPALVLAVLLAVTGARARAAAPAAAPPLDIAADNVTGSHGPEGDVVTLNGNVRITRRRTVLTADSGRYLKASGMLFLDGRVKMVDSLTTLTCDHASYSENDDLLQVEGNVVLHDGDAVLEAPAGTYDRRTGRAALSGPVKGRDKRLRLVSDLAYYLRDSSLVQARGRVHGVDDEHKTELDAQSVDYDRLRKVAVATGDPVLRARDDDGRATELRALKLVVNTETRVADALDSVRVSRDTLQARGDRAHFDDAAGVGWLLGHPRVWDDQTVVTGDSLEILTEKRRVRQVRVRPNAVMDYVGRRPGTAGEASRLTGDQVDVYFTKDDIDSLVAVGQAHNEYQGTARPGKTAERNRAKGDTITVFFKDRKIDRARVEGQAQGSYALSVDEGDTTAMKKEVVEYDARRIEFEVPRSAIVLDRDAHLTYQDLALQARRVRYDVGDQTLVAEGSPVLHDRGDRVSGGLMTYDMEARVGTIYRAETSYEKGLYHGDRIRKVNDNELDVMNGAYSTCTLDEPHYHFSAHWMKIYLKDKLVAKPVVFYLRNVPLLALPFWIFPIKPGRHSGFLFPQFELGFNSSAGQFVRNAGYYWAPNDYMDVTAAGDYYQTDPSWVLRGEGEYKLLYRLDGSFRGSFARDEAPGRKSENWDFSADHSEEITPRTRLVARASFVSSKDYNSNDQFGRTLAQRLNRFLTSNFAISHNADWASFNFVADRRQDLDADQGLVDANNAVRQPLGTRASSANLTSSLPNISVAFPTRALGSLPGLKGTIVGKSLKTLYLGLSSSFLAQNEQRAYVAGHTPYAQDTTRDSITTLGQLHTDRWGQANSISLSDSRRAFGWLNVQPRIGSNVVVFDHDELGHRTVPAATWSTGATMSTTFYGTFRPRFLGLDGLRHVVSPNVSLAYSPAFDGLTYLDSAGVRHDRFAGFGGIGVSGFKQSRMNFSLDQRFQVKLKRGDKVTRLDNLLSWSMGSSYDFLWKEDGARHPLAPIGSSVLLQPPGNVNASLSWTTDPYLGRPVQALAYNVNMNYGSGGQKHTTTDLPVDQTARTQAPAPAEENAFKEDWSVGLAYSYSGGYSTGPSWSAQKSANLVGRIQLTPAWAVEYSASYDVTRSQLMTQRFVVTRDLHCWIATFTRSFVVGGETEYYFRLAVKDQKELFIERGTRQGSLGGIQ